MDDLRPVFPVFLIADDLEVIPLNCVDDLSCQIEPHDAASFVLCDSKKVLYRITFAPRKTSWVDRIFGEVASVNDYVFSVLESSGECYQDRISALNDYVAKH